MKHFSAPRVPWGDFPPVVRNGDLNSLSVEPEYRAAKQGDSLAALSLVSRKMTPEFIQAVASLQRNPARPSPYLLPVMARETAGHNRLPLAVAAILERALGWRVCEDVVQTNHVGRTDQKADFRLLFSPDFLGEIEVGRDYVLLDDTLTMGGTVAALRGYIESHGGHVLGAAVMTAHPGALDIAIKTSMIERIGARHGDAMQILCQEVLGHGLEGLTQGEAGHFRAASSADSLRNRFAAARHEAESRAHASAAEDAGYGLIDGIRRSLLNSAGRRIHPTDDGIAHFWRWFGDSQTVDADGRPLVFYHGTVHDFSGFDPAKSRTTGVFFSGTPEYANIVAELDGARSGHARVIPVYARVLHPQKLLDTEFTRAATREAFSGGFDALITHNAAGALSQLTLFDASSLKSALGNSGCFDPYSADLTDDAPTPRYLAEQHAREAAQLHAGAALAYVELVEQGYAPNDAVWADFIGQWPPARGEPSPRLFADADRANADIGDWALSDYTTDDGTPVDQLRSCLLKDLYLPECDAQGQVSPAKRAYVERYQQRFLAGEQPPPLSVLEMNDGRLRVIDGHRRVLAAKAAGLEALNAWVSPLFALPDGRLTTLMDRHLPTTVVETLVRDTAPELPSPAVERAP